MRDKPVSTVAREITQREIEHLLILRQEALEARAVAAKKHGELDAEDERLLAALEAGTPVEPGPFHLLFITEQTGRSVAWRKVVEEHLGKPFAEKILADTAPGSMTTLKVLQEVNGR